MLALCIFIIQCNDSKVNNSGNPVKNPKFMGTLDISFEDSVEVDNISPDSEHSEITFDITVYHGGSVSGYKAEIKSFSPHYVDTGWTALLYNTSLNDTLWQYEFKWDLDDTSWVGINEIADGDELYLEIRESGSNYTETFIQNGDTLTLTYAKSLLDGMRGDTTGYSRQEKNLIDSLSQEFEEFYDTTTAINNNYEGELMTYLLDSDDFWQLISDRVYDGNPPKGMTTEIMSRKKYVP